jgi:hypothetical protein
MTFEEIIQRATPGETLMVDGKEFSIHGVERAHGASGEEQVWLWSEEGAWLMMDADQDELLALYPTEEDLEEGEDGYATYRGEGFEDVLSDQGRVQEWERGGGGPGGEPPGEGTFLLKQFESDGGEVIRRLERGDSGEAFWFYGRRLAEEDVREV